MARTPASATTLPQQLRQDIADAGYYPALVCDVVENALAGEPAQAHLVHQETTLDRDAVRRHITVLVLTPTTLVVAHADDHAPEPGSGMTTGAVATASTEVVPLSRVRGVMLTHVVADPDRYVPGSLGHELTLTIGWGTLSRVDLLPATCPDPQCEADHGYDGTITGDDISLRISAVADGDTVLQRAREFSRQLSTVVGRDRR